MTIVIVFPIWKLCANVTFLMGYGLEYINNGVCNQHKAQLAGAMGYTECISAEEYPPCPKWVFSLFYCMQTNGKY